MEFYDNSLLQLSQNCSGWIASEREARFQAASASNGEVMFVFGGYEYPDGAEDVVSTDSVEKYDPSKGYWSMTNWKMPGARNEPCAVSISQTEVLGLGWLPKPEQLISAGDADWREPLLA